MKRWLFVVALGVALVRYARRLPLGVALEEQMKNLSDWFVALLLSSTSEFEKKVQA
ncbi:MAG: hypothetical protein PVSMB4_16490 [Ktedonobacterales bacterium]